MPQLLTLSQYVRLLFKGGQSDWNLAANANAPLLLSSYTFSTSEGQAATNRTQLQLAVNDAIAARRPLLNNLPAGTYPIAKNDSVNPYLGLERYAIDLGNGTTGFTFYGSPVAVLRMANNQMTGSTACHLFIGKNLKSLSFIGGIYDNGSQSQSGWTNGYMQTGPNCIKLFYDEAGGGLQDILFDGATMQNVFGNTINVVSTDSLYNEYFNGVFTMKNCRFKTYGEGVQTANFAKNDFFDCVCDDTGNTAVGDHFEPSGGLSARLERCIVKGGSNSSSFVDLNGTREAKVIDCNFTGTNSGANAFNTNATSDFTDDSLLVINTYIRGTKILGGSNKTKTTFKDCHLENCGSAGAPMMDIGSPNGGAQSDPQFGCTVTIDGGHIENCGTILLVGKATLTSRNNPVIMNSPDFAVTVGYNSATPTDQPTLDVDFIIKKPVQAAYLVDGAGGGGNGVRPRGRIRGVVDSAGAVAFWNNYNGTERGFENVDVDVTLVNPPTSFAQGFWVGFKYLVANTDVSTGVPSLAERGGSMGQETDILCAADQTSTASWKLTANVTGNSRTILKMKHLGENKWQEISRTTSTTA